ncbi:hypothetical protein KIPB_017253, partial [Kipferlia bialata]
EALGQGDGDKGLWSELIRSSHHNMCGKSGAKGEGRNTAGYQKAADVLTKRINGLIKQIPASGINGDKNRRMRETQIMKAILKHK